MVDNGLRIGGDPHRFTMHGSPLNFLFIANLILVIVLGIVGASLSVRDKKLSDEARKAALSFIIIGFLIIFIALIVEVLMITKEWTTRRLMQLVVTILVGIALVAFIIGTAISYMKSKTEFGDWNMSALWVTLPCLGMSILKLLTDQ